MNGEIELNLKNIDEFKQLIIKAEKEVEQLRETLAQLQKFEFDIDLKP